AFHHIHPSPLSSASFLKTNKQTNQPTNSKCAFLLSSSPLLPPLLLSLPLTSSTAAVPPSQRTTATAPTPLPTRLPSSPSRPPLSTSSAGRVVLPTLTATASRRATRLAQLLPPAAAPMAVSGLLVLAARFK
ncbi:hypothetical protein GQ42DRAFT_87963, partial [Ramicandelaber brevisporus]